MREFVLSIGSFVGILGEFDVEAFGRLSVVVVRGPEELDEVPIMTRVVKFWVIEVDADSKIDEDVFICVKSRESVVELIQGFRTVDCVLG